MDTNSFEQFANTIGLTMVAEWAIENPNIPEWRDANHWKITLSVKGHGSRVIYFSMGFGLGNRKPTIPEVLESVQMSVSIANDPFEIWCADYGYDPDSRKAERTYRACQSLADTLTYLFGDHYQTFLSIQPE